MASNAVTRQIRWRTQGKLYKKEVDFVAKKLTLKGFKYPLDHYQLKDREGLGVSNEITADVADVSWEQGVLLMIQSKD